MVAEQFFLVFREATTAPGVAFLALLLSTGLKIPWDPPTPGALAPIL